MKRPQVDAYSQVLRRMNGKRVVVRTLDIGADKVPSYLPLPHEENSALGCRAIRLCFAQPDVFPYAITGFAARFCVRHAGHHVPHDQ